MFKIKILNNISATGLKELPKNNYDVSADINDPDAILVRSAKMHDMKINDNLKAVGRAGAGVNNIPIDKMNEKGVVVFNSPGANANAVKELVISSILLSSRNICQAWNHVNNLPLDNLKNEVELSKKNYIGSELPGKTLGIIGLGAIGVQIANSAHNLGMNVIGFDPGITINNAWQLNAGVKKSSNLNQLLKKSDFVSFHVPLVEATKNLLNKENICLLPKGATVLNFARYGIIDEEALIKALDNKDIKYYITDFPVDKIKNHNRVIALPHLGASTIEAENNCAVMVARQIKDYLENGNIVNSVNFPEVIMPRNGKQRIIIAHKNIPNMVGQISTAIANAKININDLLNKSKNEIAYSLIDLESKIPNEVINNLRKIKGVLNLTIV
jgi:D-3-phosphoglycerate dehydrogenase